MKTITMKDLQGVVDRLNQITNNKLEPWDRETKKANIGTYYLDGAYGGWSLVKICNQSGGVNDIFNNGFRTKRELYNLIRSYILGLNERVI